LYRYLPKIFRVNNLSPPINVIKVKKVYLSLVQEKNPVWWDIIWQALHRVEIIGSYHHVAPSLVLGGHFPRSLIWKALKSHPSFTYLDISAQNGWNYRFPSLGEIPVAVFWQVTIDPSWSPRKLITLIYKKLRVMKAFTSSIIRTESWPSFIIKSLLHTFSYKNELNRRARVVILAD
jgi:hypothetical protein